MNVILEAYWPGRTAVQLTWGEGGKYVCLSEDEGLQVWERHVLVPYVLLCIADHVGGGQGQNG